MNTSNVTNYKPKTFAELLAFQSKRYNVGIEREF